jgi:hypothetical protein
MRTAPRVARHRDVAAAVQDQLGIGLVREDQRVDPFRQLADRLDLRPANCKISVCALTKRLLITRSGQIGSWASTQTPS